MDATPPGPVSVNRTVPEAEEPKPLFSDNPTDGEIQHSGILGLPISPTAGAPDDAENRELARAIVALKDGDQEGRLRQLENFIANRPGSRWRLGVLVNLGAFYREYSRYSQALATFEEAWRLGKDEGDYDSRVLADLAIAGLAEIYVKFVRQSQLRELRSATSGRAWTPLADERVAESFRRLAGLERSPRGNGRNCGPMAIESLLSFGAADYTRDPRMQQCMDVKSGVSLTQVESLSRDLGLNLKMARREPGTPIPVPSVVHWKLDHFSALLESRGDLYRIVDSNLGDVWIHAAALDTESTGYFLIPGGDFPKGWKPVQPRDGSRVISNCVTTNATPSKNNQVTCSGNKVGSPCGGGEGMAVWSVHPMMVNLSITDAPMSYSPPVGPKVEFRVTYNRRQDTTFSNGSIYANVGSNGQWSTDWIAWVNDKPLISDVTVNVPGGGTVAYRGIAAGAPSGNSTLDRDTQVILKKITNDRYERWFPDGSKQIFAKPGAQSAPFRKIYMTEWIDPQGNKLTFNYNASGQRLTSVVDAIGQVTTIGYASSTDNRITSVEDPFHRVATLEYSPALSLWKVTDTIGIVSQFEYDSVFTSNITSMTTPYGTTKFVAWDPDSGGHVGEVGGQRLDIIDPEGGVQRVEYWDGSVPVSDLKGVPLSTEMATVNDRLNIRNSFYWDQRAMALHPGDRSKAKLFHWAIETIGTTNVLNDVPVSTKMPLENRVWYNYPGQSTPEFVGTISRPSAIGRILDDGATAQIFRYEYNTLGNVTKAVDPLGRETVYEYDANLVDVVRIKQKNGAGYDVLASYTYNDKHEPLTATDAAMQTTTFTYNARGQLTTVRNARNDTWTLAYDTGVGREAYLRTISGPLPGSTIALEWDSFGRLGKVTDVEGYWHTFIYDALDRLTEVHHKSGSYEQVIFDRLSLRKYRDSLGRWSEMLVDGLGHPTFIRDPLGRTTTFSWCDCGSLEKITDGLGHATSWERDDQGRVKKEILADGSSTYEYETTTSRLKSVTDAKGQSRSYNYAKDNRLLQITYAGAAVATPSVAFSYDSVYGRLQSRTDGASDVTNYSYNPIVGAPSLGAGRVATIDGPLANDVIAYSYDELGRVLSRSIAGVVASVQYDPLGRVTNVASPLGGTNYGYDGLTTRLKTVTNPGGITRTYNYFPEAQGHRLKEIRNERSGGINVSRFVYEQDVASNITGWNQTIDANPTRASALWYDAADQLTAVTQSDLSSGAPLKRFGYAYDNAGNRIAEQVDDASSAASHNELNELAGVQPGGALMFRGETNEPALLTVAGHTVTTTGDNKFATQASVGQGTTTVGITATDGSGNATTQSYQVSVSGATRALTYDLNGNLTADGARTYEWDAVDRLTAINEGLRRTEFTYDGFSRRTRVVEKVSGTIVSTKRLLWVGKGIAEERDGSSTNGPTLKRYLGQGVQQGATNLFYSKDHLGTIRELVDTTGAVRARYDYDPFGRRTKLAGDLSADFGFAGMYQLQSQEIALARYRAYDPGFGRWLSRDPLGLAGGLNLYAYVGNNPPSYNDPDGLYGPFVLAVAIFAALAGMLLAPNVLDPPPGQTSDRTGQMFATIAAVAAVPFGCRIPFGGHLPGTGGTGGSQGPEGPPTTVDESVQRGLVRPGGKLEEILRALEQGYEQDIPQTTQEGLEVVATAADAAGLEPGRGTPLPDGGYVLDNAGGVRTTIDPSGNITVTRGIATLLCKKRP